MGFDLQGWIAKNSVRSYDGPAYEMTEARILSLLANDMLIPIEMLSHFAQNPTHEVDPPTPTVALLYGGTNSILAWAGKGMVELLPEEDWYPCPNYTDYLVKYRQLPYDPHNDPLAQGILLRLSEHRM